MVQNKSLTQAVAAVTQRSERQEDLQKLVGSFVDVGILPQIRNVNNQIIYGRRGTGKTHILRVLALELKQNEKNAVLYLDARTLGSTSQFSDADIPLPARCLALFRDILGEIYNLLLEHVVNTAPVNADKILDLLTGLGALTTDPIITYAADTMTSRALTKDSQRSGIEMSAGARSGVKVSASDTHGESSESEQTETYSAKAEDKVIFPALSSTLRSILQGCGSKMYLLIDEWSSLPIDIQPYLAEFLKRGLLPLTEVVVKIASLEYRSNFRLDSERGHIGFEIGADMSAAIDID